MRSVLLCVLSLVAVTCSVVAPVAAAAARSGSRSHSTSHPAAAPTHHHSHVHVSRLSDASLAAIVSSERFASFLEEHPETAQMLVQWVGKLEVKPAEEHFEEEFEENQVGSRDEAESDSAEVVPAPQPKVTAKPTPQPKVTAKPTPMPTCLNVNPSAIEAGIKELAATLTDAVVQVPPTGVKGAVKPDVASADSADDFIESPYGYVQQNVVERALCRFFHIFNVRVFAPTPYNSCDKHAADYVVKTPVSYPLWNHDPPGPGDMAW